MNSVVQPEVESFKPLWVVADAGDAFDFDDMTPEDQRAVGWHEVMVPAHLDERAAVAFAMGLFYRTVPIEYTDMFDYQVFDEGEVELELDRNDDRWELANSYEGVLFAYDRELGEVGLYRRLTSSGWRWECPVVGWQGGGLEQPPASS